MLVLTRYRLFSLIHIFTFLIHKLVFGFFPIQLKKLYLSPGGQLKARGVRRDICRQIHVSTLSFNSALKKKENNLNPAQNRDQNRGVNTVKVMKKRQNYQGSATATPLGQTTRRAAKLIFSLHVFFSSPFLFSVIF